MPRFFMPDITGGSVTISGDDARHIARSLRMREDEELTLCDTKGTDYRCRIVRVDGEEVQVDVLESMSSRNETACRLRLYQAMPKGDKFEHIVQKATELGVSDIVPVITARCISRPLLRSMEKKAARFQKIAYEAAKQSGRGRIPAVHPMQSFADAVADMARDELPVLLYEQAGTPLRDILTGTPRNISLMVGSEGGFSVREAEQAADAGVRVASLGSRILRCETAPTCALSAILFFLGEF